MGKSVKLTDGSYIDAEGVWDNALGMTQEEANNGDGIHVIQIKDYFTTTTSGMSVTSGTITWFRIGKVVYLYLYNAHTSSKTTAAQTSFSSTCSALGLPKPKTLAPAPMSGDSSAYAGLFCADTAGGVYLHVVSGITYFMGTLIYIAAD